MNSLAQCVSMATLTTAAARAADDFVTPLELAQGQKTGVIVGLCVTTLLSNVCGVKVSPCGGDLGIRM